MTATPESIFELHYRHLETMAAAIIQQLRRIPELGIEKIAIVGGLAVLKHATPRRTTDDIDFLITAKSRSVGLMLLSLPDTPFQQEVWKLWYRSPSGRTVRVDFLSWEEYDFIPKTVGTRIDAVLEGQLPYIPKVDLICMKVLSCGMRRGFQTRVVDAEDLKCLVEAVDNDTPIKLVAWQWSIVVRGFQDVVKYSSKGEDWWRRKLAIGEMLDIVSLDKN